MKKFIMSFAGFIILISVSLLVYFKTPNSDLTIYTSKDSYASKYAKMRGLLVNEVSESDLEKFSISIEEFKYNIIDGGIEITEYLGISKRLVIPSKINGYVVKKINKSLFNNRSIETIVISDSVENIDGIDDVKIECLKSIYCETLINDENVNATMLYDSDNVDFNYYVGLFSYNLKNNEIEVTRSTNIIPSIVNGYNVTKLNIDLSGEENVYIPNTVTSINIKNINKTLLYISIGMIISYIIYLIMILTNSNKNINEVTKNVSLYIVSLIYMIVMGFISYNYNDFYIGYAIICSLIYIFISVALKINKKSSILYEEKVKETGMFISETLHILDKVDSKNKYKLKDLIRYSEPVSINEVIKIEKNIQDTLNELNEDNVDLVKELIKERNSIIKLKR